MAPRLSPTGHVPEITEGGKQSKCAACKKKVSKQCEKCDIGLHLGKCDNCDNQNWQTSLNLAPRSKIFSNEVPCSKWSAGRLVKVLSVFLKHVKENFMHYCNMLFL